MDKEEWGYVNTELLGKIYSFSTLNNEEYVTASFESVGTGSYGSNGKEVEDHFMIIRFLGVDIEPFEVEANNRKLIVRWLISTEVIKDGVFNLENAVKFKEKYAYDVSGKYGKGTTIIINN